MNIANALLKGMTSKQLTEIVNDEDYKVVEIKEFWVHDDERVDDTTLVFNCIMEKTLSEVTVYLTLPKTLPTNPYTEINFKVFIDG